MPLPYAGPFEYRTASGNLLMREAGIVPPGVVTAYRRSSKAPANSPARRATSSSANARWRRDHHQGRGRDLPALIVCSHSPTSIPGVHAPGIDAATRGIAMQPRPRNAAAMIVLGGLVAGTLDIVYAIGFWAIKAGGRADAHPAVGRCGRSGGNQLP
jgi:hypothetical protein